MSSFLAKLMPVVQKTEADVEAAAKKIMAKATADVAAIRKSAATTKLNADKAAKVAAFKAALADYKARLDADPAPVVVLTSTGPTGTSGA